MHTETPTTAKTINRYKTSAIGRRGRKSKDGCGTCKIRKVKCDEVKPFCIRCKTAGVACDGYLPGKPRTTSTTPQISSARNKQFILPAPSASPSTLKFGSSIEALLFEDYQSKLAPELTGTFETGFFSRLVLQSAHSELFILKTVIALSALSSSQKLKVISLEISRQHYALAFTTYQTAVQSMSSSLSQQASPRKAHMTAKYCGIPIFQREAVQLLREYGKREGNWDSLTLADIDQVYMNLEAEEEGTYKLGNEIQDKAEKRLIFMLRGNAKQIGYVEGVHGKFADVRNKEMQMRDRL